LQRSRERCAEAQLRLRCKPERPRCGFSQIFQPIEKIGSGGRDRTYGQAINSRLLYR
jgi:hypothetical protein